MKLFATVIWSVVSGDCIVDPSSRGLDKITECTYTQSGDSFYVAAGDSCKFWCDSGFVMDGYAPTYHTRCNGSTWGLRGPIMYPCERKSEVEMNTKILAFTGDLEVTFKGAKETYSLIKSLNGWYYKSGENYL